MTTQNTQFEHSDVDASAVEQPSNSETSVNPTTEVEHPVEAVEQTESPSAEPAETTSVEGEEHSDASTVQGEEQASVSKAESQEMQSEATPDMASSIVIEQSWIESAPMSEVSDTSPSSDEGIPLVEEEVHPFAAFLEEFRQAESRWDAQPEPFVPFMPIDSSFVASGEPVVAEEVPSDDADEDAASHVSVDSEDAPGVGEEVAALPPTLSALVQRPPAEQGVGAQGHAEVVVPPVAEATPPPAPVERPVSPLLRPASRLRVPRHGLARHREEPTVEAPQASVEPQSAPAEVSVAPAEAPRPARRYRFDRPTANAASQVRPEESKDKDIANRTTTTSTPILATDNGAANETQARPATSVTQPVEQPTARPVGQEQPQGAETPAPSPIVEHGRRRHTQERHREKAQQPIASTAAPATQAANVTMPVQEPITLPVEAVAPKQEEVAPEDLPPLEYADLQKASTRRRRRHRSGTTISVPAVAAPIIMPTPPAVIKPVSPPMITEVPAAQVVAPPATPRTVNNGATSAAASNPFNIVSGYTVSQMNQGNEMVGPFMGPEPSPARGSLLSRDMRSGRAEVQRPTAYPARSNDSIPSTASVNQLANVVAQAIQTQTDRMVAELRRANQAPTNVSVTLPPFPSTERVGVFVDVANLLYSARTLRMAVDFGKLLDFLRGNRRLVRAHAYCPTSPQPGDEQMFLQAVKGLGYRITTKNYKTFSSGAKKADLDLDLCMDVVRLVDGRAVDCVVLVSGDSDFMPMLDYCSEHGVRVEVAAFDEAMSQTLRQSCDLFINLSMLEEIRA